MNVLLLQDVERLGQAGEVKRVADGYARNYLFPRELAVLATPGAIKQAEAQRKAEVRREVQAITEAQALAAELDGLTVTFQARAGETERLYGSITNVNIAEALSEKVGQEVDRRKIVIDDPIKTLGSFTVHVKLHKSVIADVAVSVVAEQGE